MRNKPVHLGKGSQISNSLDEGFDFGTFLLDYLKSDPINFIQFACVEKVDLRMARVEKHGRQAYVAFFVENGSAAPVSPTHVDNSGWIFFEGHDEQPALTFARKMHSAGHTAESFLVTQTFWTYGGKYVPYRLSKNASLLPAIVYANNMIRRLAHARGDENIEDKYVNWMTSTYARGHSAESAKLFEADTNVTPNRLALAMIKNDVHTDRSLVGVENMLARQSVSEWLKRNMASICECEEVMAQKDFRALA